MSDASSASAALSRAMESEARARRASAPAWRAPCPAGVPLRARELLRGELRHAASLVHHVRLRARPGLGIPAARISVAVRTAAHSNIYSIVRSFRGIVGHSSLFFTPCVPWVLRRFPSHHRFATPKLLQRDTPPQMQALVAQAPPHNVLRATPSFSAEFGAAAGGAVAVGGPVAFLVGAETCRGTAAVLLDAVKNRRTCAVRMIAYSMCGRRSRLAVAAHPRSADPPGAAGCVLRA